MFLHFIESHESRPPCERFGLTIWWQQQDDSWENRSFGVFFGTKIFSIDCGTSEAAASHAALRGAAAVSGDRAATVATKFLIAPTSGSTDLPDGLFRHFAVQPNFEKYSSSRLTQDRKSVV